MRRYYGLLLAVLLWATSLPAFAAEDLVLWYRQPARQWTHALPLGNGRLGAMVFGGVDRERIALNEDSLWAGGPRDRHNPEALKALPEVRRLLFADRIDEAAALAKRTMLGVPPTIESYQTLGDLLLETPGQEKYTEYRHELDLDTAVDRVTYTVDDARFTREVFVSAPDQVLALRWTCDRPGRINATVRLARPQEAEVKAPAADQLVLWGACNGGKGVRFEAHVRAVAQGGKLSAKSSGLTVEAADSLVLLVASATSYRHKDPQSVCLAQLEAAVAQGYEALRARHLRDHQAIFRRVTLDLGPAAHADWPTDRRLAALRSGEEDPQLAALYFQLGRYLLMASSRPGGLPANLQGVWNDRIEAPWNADFHANINLQMNYWPAEVCNLAECHLPLLDLVDTLVAPGSETARRHYGARGWVLHHLTDAWGFTVPADGLWGVWPMGGAWLCQHMFEHYRFSGDRQFLARRAYPVMKGAARFMLDFLVEAPPGTPVAGRLVTAPSHSPENAFRTSDGKDQILTYGATMDLEIVHDLLSNCIEAIDTLGPDGRFEPEFRAELAAALKRLAPLQVSRRTGALQEWIRDYEEPEPDHRHISHVFALYPGRQITPRGTPELAAAVRKTLVRRSNGNATWSKAWQLGAWARLEDGDHAHSILRRILAEDSQINLLDADTSLLVDSTLGGAAGIAEMLLQSHAGEVALLPALPGAWKNGRVEGLRARGGMEVTLAWNNGRATEATLKTTLAGRRTVRAPKGQQIAQIVDAVGKPVVFEKGCDGMGVFQVAAGGIYRLGFE